ncbi:DUF3987 domain-containing protein [Candidatus Micrarchaeota archaeon]|nr:DUF3987 domain-containing protein [Candidatus Micrarchaeota archaeon]
MGRNVENWLTSYMTLMSNTEPARVFDKWTGYSIIAAALRRKVKLRLGRLTYYPNIYVVFVAEPGVARKTQAIKFGSVFIDKISEIKTSADSTTKEALTDDLKNAEFPEIMPDGTSFVHSSLSIISKEFESFLGQKKENSRMLIALTDLFDCPDVYAARTRHGPSIEIIKPWLNLLAATTPDSLASSLPASAIGGGLTSRILFIWANKKKKPVAIPSMTEKEKVLQEMLLKDLYQIVKMRGDYIMTADCVKKWENWYDNYDEDESGIRICTDKSFNGWYSRKPSYIMKVAMLVAAAKTNKLSIEWSHVLEAINEIEEVEHLMSNAFVAIGKSEITAEVATVTSIIDQFEWISEKKLLSLVWRDIDANKFDNVIGTAVKAGKVLREYKGPKGEVGVWYRSKTTVKENGK